MMASPLVKYLCGQYTARGRNIVVRKWLSSSMVNQEPPKVTKSEPKQIDAVDKQILESFPTFFSAPHPFSLYAPDLLFDNQVRDKKYKGLAKFIWQVFLFKMYCNIRFVLTKVDVLATKRDYDNSCVLVKWRTISKPGQLILLRPSARGGKLDIISRPYIAKFSVNEQGKVDHLVVDHWDVYARTNPDQIEDAKNVDNNTKD